MPVARALSRVVGLFQARSRRVAVNGARAHIEFREATAQQRELLASALSRVSASLGRLTWVDVNPDTQRVTFAFEHGAYGPEELCAAVEAAEREAGIEAAPFSELARQHPDGAEALRLLVELLADTAAFVVGLGLRFSPVPALPFGGNLVALLSLVRSVPRLELALARRLGPERADFLLNLVISLAQGVAQRPFNSFVDALHKLALHSEVTSQGRLWSRREGDLCKPPDTPMKQRVERRERPVPLPRGPIEEYADRAVFVSLGGFGLSFLTTRSFQRATAALFGGLPRPARLGREVFAARLARSLAGRGVLVLDPSVLRRLDRIDCLVLDGALTSRRQFVIGAVQAEDPEDNEEARQQAQTLFDAKRPLEVASDGLWRLGPYRRSDASCDVALRQTAEARAKRGALVLALERAGRVVAIVEVEILAQTGVEELIDAAHDAEMRVVIASASDDVLHDLNADHVISESEGLFAGVRRLQREGHGVCVVSAGDVEALRAADCGVALCSSDRPTAWSADVLASNDLADVLFVIQACASARRVSKRSVNIALAAATLGTVASAGGLLSWTHRRVMFVVNSASLVSMFNAVRSSRALEVYALPAPRDPTPWHALEPEGVLARLGTTHHGLSAAEVERRQAQLPWPKPPGNLAGLGEAITDELFNPLAPLLAAGAALSAMVGSLSDAAVLGGVVGSSAVAGGVQRFRTERRLRVLSRTAPLKVLVRRHGSVRVVEESDLVHGDVIVLNAGDVVPADCRVVEARGLEVDASSLTGESLPVQKHVEPAFDPQIADRRSMLYAGTAVAAGHALAVVVATGDATVSRHGATGARVARGQGGVERRLRALMDLTGPVALAACAGVVGGGVLRGRKLEDLVGTGVSLAVASVPEGLPLLATAAQLSAAERLSKRNALVRNPRSIEALGRINVICLDKTGTVTRGELELMEVHDGRGFVPVAECRAAEATVVAAGMRATATEQRGAGAVDPTDEALRRAGAHLGVSVYSGASGWRRTSEIHFAPGRNYHATLAQTDAGPLLSVKGAPENVLPLCDRASAAAGPLTEAGRAELAAAVEQMARKGLRVLAVAERSAEKLELLAPEHVGGLTLLGFLAFSDPVRPSARRAIAGIRRAGVQTVMLTGDHPRTADVIARELGLLEGRRVVSSGELANLSDEELDAALDGIAVFARVTPSQKVRVVRALQRRGLVVGMVGDGTNDAPAIRLADCGIAIGEHGTSAARGAADVVLMDGRVETLVDAIIEGRAMWASVRDAVSILLGGNLGEIGFTLGVGLIEGRPPLNARQLLLVNLLTDVAPAMAIALRPPSSDSLEALARLTPEQTLGRPLNRQIAFRALATGMGASSAWVVARMTGSAKRARTVALAALVGSQLGQTLRSGGLSTPVVTTSLLSAATLVSVIQTPGLSHFFGCRPLGPLGWGTAVVASIAATSLASAAQKVLERDVLEPLELAESWRDARADEHGWNVVASHPPPAPEPSPASPSVLQGVLLDPSE